MIEIVTSYSGKVNTGNYENVDPFFSMKEIIDAELTDEEKQKRQKELSLLCKANFDSAVAQLKCRVEPSEGTERKKMLEAYQSIRWYEKGLKKYPSVTSILSYFSEPFDFPKEELKKLADRGTVIHALVEVYMKTREWISLDDLVEYARESWDKQLLEAIETVRVNGLDIGNVDFIDFEDKYPLEYIDSEFEVFNDEYEYAGRCDLKVIYDNKITLCDIKTGGVHKDKTKKAMEQLSAYAQNDKEVEQIMMIPLNHNVKQGWSKPTIAHPSEHWEDFLTKRTKFKEELGA